MTLLSADEIRGAYAIMPTPSNPGADHWSATDTVNVAETERLTNQLIVDGVDALIALGTTGECATITEDEFRVYTEAVCRAAAGRVPTIVGATAMGTHQIMERLRIVRDNGATGTMLGLPMWQPCTEDMALRLYAGVAEAFPDLTVMLYMNVRAFRFDFGLTFWEKLIDVAPNVTCAKYGATPGLADLFEVTKGKVNFLPIDMAAWGAYQATGGKITAVWSTGASMGPRPTIAVARALAAKDEARLAELDAKIAKATETFMPPNPAEFAFYNIQLEKIRMEASGYCAPGPIRPPYDVVPEEYDARARECGRRWAELDRELAG